MRVFADHVFIKLDEYQAHLRQLGGKYSFSNEKVSNILLLVNLGRLLVSLIEYTGAYDLDEEQKALEIHRLELQFPDQFIPVGGRKGTAEALVLIDLRTQIFVQYFLDALEHNRWGDWNTSNKLDEVFQIESDPVTGQSHRVCLII
jgi:hypothetical protein